MCKKSANFLRSWILWLLHTVSAPGRHCISWLCGLIFKDEMWVTTPLFLLQPTEQRLSVYWSDTVISRWAIGSHERRTDPYKVEGPEATRINNLPNTRGHIKGNRVNNYFSATGIKSRMDTTVQLWCTRFAWPQRIIVFLFRCLLRPGRSMRAKLSWAESEWSRR